MTKPSARFARVWLGPFVLGTVSALALCVALLRDGVLDVVCGLSLLAVGLFGIVLAVRCRLAGRRPISKSLDLDSEVQ